MSKEAKLGLFVLAVFAVFFFFTINMGVFLYKGESQPYYLYFDKIQTLEERSPVYQSGINVGEVANIAREIIKEPTMQVFTVVEVSLNAKALITTNSIASIKPMGMVGNEQYIEISYGNGELAEPGAKIKGQSPYAIDQVIENAVQLTEEVRETVQGLNVIFGDVTMQKNMVQLIENLEDFSSNINKLLGGEQARLQTILANAAAASDDLRSMMATAELFVSDMRSMSQEVRSDFKATFKHTAEITDSLRAPLKDDLPAITKNLSEFSAKLNGAIERADTLIAKMENVIDSNRDNLDLAFTNVTEFTEEAKKASQKVNLLIDDIKGEGGLIGTLIYDREMAQAAKSTITEVSGVLSNISSVPDRFSFNAELLYFPDEGRFDPDDSFLRADMGVQFDLTDSFYVYGGGNNLGSHEGIEVLAGYQYGAFTFYGGLIETELAGGINWQALERLLLGMEGVGVTDGDQARLDLYAEYLIWENLYLKGGVQDITDELYPNLGMKVQF
ncbi:MAG: MlaD family protein [Candidatus Hinthialibacter antarcticus]|nr:MlaD family protein [Candidatus Hinthialibacter antarcticus]